MLAELPPKATCNYRGGHYEMRGRFPCESRPPAASTRPAVQKPLTSCREVLSTVSLPCLGVAPNLFRLFVFLPNQRDPFYEALGLCSS